MAMPKDHADRNLLFGVLALQADLLDAARFAEACAPWLGRNVALKELRPERSDNPAVWKRFLAEARITGQLEHPGIVPVYELAKPGPDAHPFYTMRFVKGRTLTQAIQDYHAKRQENKAG